MIINKFQAKTESEAVEKAKKEMGPEVVIMNVRTVRPKGMFRAFKGITYEVTAALEEEMPTPQPAAKEQALAKQPERINYAADEQIQIPIAPPQKQALEQQAEKVLEQLQKQGGQQAENPDPMKKMNPSAIEKRLDNLQSLLEERISAEKQIRRMRWQARMTERQKKGFPL